MEFPSPLCPPHSLWLQRCEDAHAHTHTQGLTESMHSLVHKHITDYTYFSFTLLSSSFFHTSFIYFSNLQYMTVLSFCFCILHGVAYAVLAVCSQVTMSRIQGACIVMGRLADGQVGINCSQAYTRVNRFTSLNRFTTDMTSSMTIATTIVE